MMPLLISIYVASIDTGIEVPIGKIITTVGIILLPACIGMLIRSKSLKIARKLERVGSIFGIIIIAFLIINFVMREVDLLSQTAAKVYISVALLCFGGFALGYFGNSNPVKRRQWHS